MFFLLLGPACSDGVSGSEPVPAGGRLVADGDTPGTYALIRRSGYNYETSDTSNAHAQEPFQHIRQSYDEELGAYVFDFYIHIDIDDDRGLPNITDRQRNEIKTDAKSPASMVGQPGDEMVFRWKFLFAPQRSQKNQLNQIIGRPFRPKNRQNEAFRHATGI